MLSKNTFFSFIFLFCLFPGQIISCNIFKSADELACLFMLFLAGLDIYKNGWATIRRLLPLWILFAIMSFYVCYSIIFCSFNTPLYVVIDVVSQIKPFVPYIIIYCLNLRLTGWARQVGQWFCIINVFFMAIFYVWGGGRQQLPFAHIAYLGTICMISGLFYLYCSLDDRGKIPAVRDLGIAFFILSFGLLCGRSKYFGQYIITICLCLFYRPGLFHNISFKHILLVMGVLTIVVMAAWHKIEYYFIQGAMDMLESESIDEVGDSYARPMLYVTGGQILLDYFPFGSGLASFASYASADHYSLLYYDYGLDKVWGLSPYKTDFICDAYYPTLSQFGVFGIFWFCLFWRWVFKPLNYFDRTLGNSYCFKYIISISLIVFLLIESIGSTQFIQAAGFQAIMLLGLLTSGHNSQNSTSKV